MKLDDFDEFCEVVVGFAELKGKQLSPAALKLFFRAMQSWDLREFKAAAEHLLCTCEFMPTPKDFTDLRKAEELTPGEAWAAALAACVDWRDPSRLADTRVARAAAAVGGLRAIAMADVEHDLPHVERRFKEAYNDLTGVEPVRHALPQIAASGARIALRGPTSIGNFLPNLQPPEDSRASLAPEEFRS